MKVKCKNCLPEDGIEVPELSSEEKYAFWQLRKKSGLRLTKELMKNGRFTHLESKYITTHVNQIPGKCNRCNYDQLEGEYILCPKCSALNFNWKFSDD